MSQGKSLTSARLKTGPTAATNNTKTTHQKRRPLRAALLLATVLAVGTAVGIVIPTAWQKTQRSEAYLPDLERMAQRAPSDGPVLALLGGRLMEAHEHRAAAETLRRAVAAGEQGEDVWMALAAASAAAGEENRGLADLRLGLRARPESAGLRAALARCQALGPAAPGAVAVAISPDGPSPLVASYTSGSFLNRLADWWGRRHPESSGYATRQAWADTQPNDAQALRLWGLALLRNRRLPAAEAPLLRALTLAPMSPAANLAYAELLEQEAAPVKASLQYLACLRLRPDWLPALLGLGRSAAQAGMNGYAASAYARAAQLQPGSANVQIALGRADLEYNSSTYYAPALAAFQAAARLAPGRVDFLTDYGNCLQLNYRWQEAEAVLRRRLAAAPDDAFCHLLLGKVLMDNGPTPARMAEAEAQTREALRLVPHVPPAEIQLAQLLLARNETGEALSLLKDAFAHDPFNRKTMKILARAYRKAGQAGDAGRLDARADSLDRAHQQVQLIKAKSARSPKDAALHEQLAALLRQTGDALHADREQAMAHLLRTDPQQAARAMQSLNTEVQSVLPGAAVTTP